MPSIDTIVYALWLMYLRKLSNEYVQQEHVVFTHLLFVDAESVLKKTICSKNIIIIQNYE